MLQTETEISFVLLRHLARKQILPLASVNSHFNGEFWKRSIHWRHKRYFGFVFEEDSGWEVTWLSWRHRFKSVGFEERRRQASVFSGMVLTGSYRYRYIVVLFCLNSLTIFWLAKSVQWIFEIGARDVITADNHFMIMSRTLKVMGNHVKFARFVLLPVSEEAKTWLPFFSFNV